MQVQAWGAEDVALNKRVEETQPHNLSIDLGLPHNLLLISVHTLLTVGVTHSSQTRKPLIFFFFITLQPRVE